jgi:hypothetical protein
MIFKKSELSVRSNAKSILIRELTGSFTLGGLKPAKTYKSESKNQVPCLNLYSHLYLNHFDVSD